MLKTTDVDLTILDPVNISEDSNIDKIGNSKINETKVGGKTAKFNSQDKSKGKNSAKFKALA